MARTDVELLKISQENLFDIIEERPEISRSLIKTLIKRLRRADELIHELTSGKAEGSEKDPRE